MRSLAVAPVRSCKWWIPSAGPMIPAIVAAMNPASASTPAIPDETPNESSAPPKSNATAATASATSAPTAPARAAGQSSPIINPSTTRIGTAAHTAATTSLRLP